MELSIIICTFNRAEFLRNNLSILMEQVDARQDVEVLVVDNNSADNTALVVSEFSSAIYLQEHDQGLSYARNKGLACARGEWVAYLDDDAYVGESWLKTLLEAIRGAHFDAFGGLFLPWYKDGKKSWFLDEYASNASWYQAVGCHELREQYFCGGNCCFKRSLLLDIGGFPVELGMSGTDISYGEEDYVQESARSRGAVLGLVPDMVIHHYTPLKKQSFKWLIASSWASGRDYWGMPNSTLSFKSVGLLLLLFVPVLLLKFSRLLQSRKAVVNIVLEMGMVSSKQVARIFFGCRALFAKRAA